MRKNQDSGLHLLVENQQVCLLINRIICRVKIKSKFFWAKALDADVAIAVSGIARPDGGTDEKPVGLVYIVALLHDEIIVAEHIFPGNRDTVRKRAMVRALLMLRELLIQE